MPKNTNKTLTFAVYNKDQFPPGNETCELSCGRFIDIIEYIEKGGGLMRKIINRDLFSPGDVVIVAVSGGIDSMVLLDALAAERTALGLRLVVAHVNHGIRNASEEEYRFVERRCAEYDVPFEGMTLDPQKSGNFHQYARNRRYEFFAETARKHGAKKIALAHHADDQAETILMRLTRGSGFIGYAGMSERTAYGELELVRPLLHVSKQTIWEYQKEKNLEFRNDVSNDEDHYTRNRFRHHVLPVIAAEDPRYSEKFAQFSTYVGEAYVLVSRLTREYLESEVEWEPTEASFPVASFLSLDRIVARDVVKRVVDRLTGNTLEISFRHLGDVLALAANVRPNAGITVDKRLRVLREYDRLRFQTIPTSPRPFSVSISGPGRHELPNGDTVIIGENPCIDDGICIEVWYNRLDFLFPVTVRTRQAGDRIRLSGGTKKVADLLIDRKVPAEERARIPLFLNAAGEIFWIPGHRIGSVTGNGEQKIQICYVKGK